MSDTETISICRDEDCPLCGWPETYTDVNLDGQSLVAKAVGCRKCGWRVELERRKADGTDL